MGIGIGMGIWDWIRIGMRIGLDKNRYEDGKRDGMGNGIRRRREGNSGGHIWFGWLLIWHHVYCHLMEDIALFGLLFYKYSTQSKVTKKGYRSSKATLAIPFGVGMGQIRIAVQRAGSEQIENELESECVRTKRRWRMTWRASVRVQREDRE
eukprot:268780-Amorphochlora_amoeboformis.AAC.1